jgi:hypothetical protein
VPNQTTGPDVLARDRILGNPTDGYLEELVLVIITLITQDDDVARYHLSLVGQGVQDMPGLAASLAAWLSPTLTSASRGWVAEVLVSSSDAGAYPVIVISVANMGVYGKDTGAHLLTFAREYLKLHTFRHVVTLDITQNFVPLYFTLDGYVLSVQLPSGLAYTQPKTAAPDPDENLSWQAAAHLRSRLTMVLNDIRSIHQIIVAPASDGMLIQLYYHPATDLGEILASRPEVEWLVAEAVAGHASMTGRRLNFAPAKLWR